MERVKSPKFSRPVYTCGDGLQFATPEAAARYRARRLKTDVLADISCGIGGQTVCFGELCRKVYGIDIDGGKLECARRNAAVYGIGNIIFIEGDALSQAVVGQVKDAGIIFCDPSRPASETVRQTHSLRPGIPSVLESYRDVTDRFAFEAPPQMPPERIDFDCEREYLSLEGKLNRLTLYFGPLKKSCSSAVVLKDADAHRLESKDDAAAAGILEVNEPAGFAFEPDPAVAQAGLLGELAAGLDREVSGLWIDNRRRLLTSETVIDSVFFKNSYRLLGKVPFDCSSINQFLKENAISRAVIRFNMAPDEYWKIRSRIEQDLSGDVTVHLYEIMGYVYIFEVL